MEPAAGLERCASREKQRLSQKSIRGSSPSRLVSEDQKQTGRRGLSTEGALDSATELACSSALFYRCMAAADPLVDRLSDIAHQANKGERAPVSRPWSP